MNKFLKLWLGVTFTFLMMLSLTGCGNTENKQNNDNKPSQSQKQDDKNVDKLSWSDIDESNYVAIIKKETKLDLGELKNLKWKNGNGYLTGAADVYCLINNDADRFEILESFMKQVFENSTEGVWTEKLDSSTFKTVRDKQYNSVSDFMGYVKSVDSGSINVGFTYDNLRINVISASNAFTFNFRTINK